MKQKSFKEYCEQRDRQIEEGLGRWLGGAAGGLVDGAAGLAGRVGNAAVSGLGHGMMQGAKRGWNTMMQGQGSNQAHNWGLQAQKAAMSGDPNQFASAAKVIYQQMKQNARQSQGGGATAGSPPAGGPPAGGVMGQPQAQAQPQMA